ncbi:PREDICTED: tyrosine-protein kinase JAK1-like [Priapulus caudatus]|uniref:Tyrosine-protein kinase JAK1-like n=1 Tax=Priapulus caudatus TaxID=37621 RepID=A0ABM1EGC6_PRICU|nr:PREDICTED: tyrosine-protein kinase JAK1-like [Priapulus caudatus]
MPSSSAAVATAESTIAWLHPGHRVTYAEGAPPLRVTFRFCYMVPDLNHQFSFDDGHGDKVLRLSRSTIRYLFHQCKHDLTTGKIPAVLHLKDAVKKCLGFALVDMLRIMRQEKIEGVRQLERKHSFKDMLPDGALSSFNLLERYYYAPKRFRKQLTIYNNIYKRHDEFFCMELYISQLLGTCKEVEYMQQRFPVRVSRSETTVEGEVRTIMQQAEIKISPFHAEQPGVRLKLSERKEWDHVCTIEELISLAFHKGAPVVVQLDDAQESPPPLPPRPISLRSPLPLTSPSLTLTNNELTHETNDDADFDHYRRMGAPPAAALANEFVFEHETSEQTSRGGQIDDAVLLPPGGSTSIVDMTGSLATTTATSLTDLEPSSPEGASGSNESCEDPSSDTAPGTDEQPENSDSGNATEREPPAGAATIVKRTCRVDIMRKNGPPEFLEFESESMAEAFVMLLDGYYRLTEKFHFNLCTAFVSPSLEELKRNKCHGAVSKGVCIGKLKERAQWKEGCYLVRESSTQYDQVCLDVCVQDQARPTSFTLQVVKKKGRYSLKDQDDALFTDIMSLVRRIGDSQQIPLSRCIHPLETDKSNLLMCRKRRQQKEEQMVAVNTEFLQPHIIPSEQLSLSAGAVMARGTFLEVHKATWELQNNMPVAVQCLRSETFTADLMKEYQDSCSRFVFLRQESLVRVYGVQLSPFALIVEQLPLGPLDQYLQAHRTKLKPVDLVEAAAFLANGLWYMEDKAVCHGNIRCCNVMACHDATGKFRVKLSDPGLPSTHADRIHWLPPENFAVINDARSYRPSRRADIWAFGTTLWEIFEFGARPRVDDLDAVEYLSQTLSDTEKLVYAYMQGARLQQPGVLATLQEECLGIERDIYMGVIMRCWARESANCGSAHEPLPRPATPPSSSASRRLHDVSYLE